MYVDYSLPVNPGNGEQRSTAYISEGRVSRNGGSRVRPYSRAAFRGKLTPSYRYFNQDIRPTRLLIK